MIIIGCLFNLVRKPRHSLRSDYKRYEDAYKDILDGVFSNDRKSYKRLLKAIANYNRDQFGGALKILKVLEKKCMRAKEYAAVYLFEALCYEETGKNLDAVTAYEKILQYDMANARAWSNLGLRYKEMEKVKEAQTAYSNAIMYEPQDAFAYNNMACLLIEMAEPEAALEYALKSIELNANIYAAMGAAALAYKMLGDEVNTDKYCKMYGLNGGNVSALKDELASI